MGIVGVFLSQSSGESPPYILTPKYTKIHFSASLALYLNLKTNTYEQVHHFIAIQVPKKRPLDYVVITPNKIT